jgi:hypothetical protein
MWAMIESFRRQEGLKLMSIASSRSLRAMAAAAAFATFQPAAAADNPLARGMWGAGSSAPIDGIWNGSDIERRSNCTNVQNNGSHGTYAEFDATTDTFAHVLAINQIGITGLNCLYRGNYQGAGAALSWTGTYSCTDGKHGSFASRNILVTQNALSIHLDIALDTTETCAIEAVIGAARFYP